MPIPEWQLPAGVDRGLWEYLHASDLVAGYDEQMRTSPLAAADVAFCERAFSAPGRLIDLGCGTGRLCIHGAAQASTAWEWICPTRCWCGQQQNWAGHLNAEGAIAPAFVKANLVDLAEFPDAGFDYAACLFSTLGMIRGRDNRTKAIATIHRLLAPNGRFVVHVHNRYYRGLGWKRIAREAAKSLAGGAGELAMPQPYGGPPLTLHHFSRREVLGLLQQNGFAVREVLAIDECGLPARFWWNVYGWLIHAEKGWCVVSGEVIR